MVGKKDIKAKKKKRRLREEELEKKKRRIRKAACILHTLKKEKQETMENLKMEKKETHSILVRVLEI